MSDRTPASGLHRVLSLTDVTASGVGIIVGAGIYVLLGPATERAGGLVWLAFALSAALCAVTALSYAELSAMFPRVGGEFEYARHVTSPRWSFIVGWAMSTGLVVAAATVSLGFARYFRYFVDVDERWPAMGLVIVTAAVAAAGIRRSTWLSVTFSLVQVGGLVFIVIAGAHHIGEVDLLAGSGRSFSESAGGVARAVALVFFAFIGFDEVATLSEETKDPTRTTPRALLWALAISAVLYVLVSMSSVSVLGPSGLAASEQPLRDVAATAVGDNAGSLMAVLAMITTTNTTLLIVTAASRMLYAMGRVGQLPAAVAPVSRWGVPHRAVGVVAAVALVFVAIGDFTLVASATDFAVYLTFVSVNLMVIVLRRRDPERARPFRSPLSVGSWPVFPVIGLVVTLWMIGLLERASVLLGLAIVAVGVAVDLVTNRRGWRGGWRPLSGSSDASR